MVWRKTHACNKYLLLKERRESILANQKQRDKTKFKTGRSLKNAIRMNLNEAVVHRSAFGFLVKLSARNYKIEMIHTKWAILTIIPS